PGGPASRTWSSASPRFFAAVSAISSCSLTRSCPMKSSSERGRSERSSSSSSGVRVAATTLMQLSSALRAPAPPRRAPDRRRRARRAHPPNRQQVDEEAALAGRRKAVELQRVLAHVEVRLDDELLARLPEHRRRRVHEVPDAVDVEHEPGRAEAGSLPTEARDH